MSASAVTLTNCNTDLIIYPLLSKLEYGQAL